MAENENCFNCVYSYWDPSQALSALSGGFPLRPACANHPDSPGRMRALPGGRICRNYRPRTAAPEGDVKQIPLSQGFFAYVDAADFDWLNQWTWRLSGGYVMRYHRGKVIYMHREIMQTPAGMVVDHKNRNKLDNTRANLRNCTHTENTRNRGKRQGASSRFIGVGRLRHGDKWYAKVVCQGERFCLGRFTDEIKAARTRDRKAVELFAESARLNFPEEWPPQRRQQVHSQRAAANGPVGANHHSPAPPKSRNAEARRRKTGRTKKAKQAKRQTKSARSTGHESRGTAAKAADAGTQAKSSIANHRSSMERPTQRTTKKPAAKRQTKSPRATGHEPRGTTKKPKDADRKARGRRKKQKGARQTHPPGQEHSGRERDTRS